MVKYGIIDYYGNMWLHASPGSPGAPWVPSLTVRVMREMRNKLSKGKRESSTLLPRLGKPLGPLGELRPINSKFPNSKPWPI
jgi:hypothetical protein